MTTEISNFLYSLKSEDGVHSNTIESYKYDILQFKKFLLKKKREITQINKKEILDFLEYLKLKKVKNRTKKRKLFALKRFYKYLVSEELIVSNPLENINMPKSEDTMSLTLTIEQINKILKTVSKDANGYKKLRSYLIIELLYATGIRVSELISIKINNIDVNKNTILIDPPEKGKTRTDRLVFFGEQTKFVLEKYLEYRRIEFNNKDDSPWLFPSNSSDGFLTRRRVLQLLQELANKVNIEKNLMHPHSFRHAFGNHLLTSGADIRVVQKLLGHTSIITTQKYTEHRDKLLETIENFHPLSKNNENTI